ncbi:phage integrase family protein [Murinocardiopsis flavida]|uniref:Phage integrase family protein n=1 Tax=Murinocardiopsis flavida TaxID=645275 RepID=A0A2P8D947_9ACTN|nr:tyrosine-type recombinase/integrase [Murinocardiopsis flavida]PSK93750.1 phage integrase family protein [Murinocardiopsis flavida]
MAERGQDIQFWEIRKRAGRRKPYEVRWRIDTAQKSKSFLTKELARDHFNALRDAAKAGDRFSTVSGEPLAWQRRTDTAFALALSWAAVQWRATDSGLSRKRTANQLARLVTEFLDDAKVKRDRAPAPLARVRSALIRYAFTFDVVSDASASGGHTVRARPAPDADRALLDWVERVSRPAVDLAELDTLKALLERSTVRLRDGKAGSKATMRLRRVTLQGMVDHAVTLGFFKVNALAGVRLKRTRSSDAVSPRTVPDYEQVRRLLGVIERDRGELAAFFALAYLSGARMGELRALRPDDVLWPEDITEGTPGWGMVVLAGSSPEAGRAWTDDGQRYENRELKSRAVGDIRMVPIPPNAVAALRRHLSVHGCGADGRLFWTGEEREPVSGWVYRSVWQHARRAVLTPTELGHGLARRVYDLRHGNASLLLGLGIAGTEVARRLGHTVEVLMTTYAHWFRSMEDESNKLLGAFFDARGPLTGHAGETGPNSTQNPSSPGVTPENLE